MEVLIGASTVASRVWKYRSLLPLAVATVAAELSFYVPVSALFLTSRGCPWKVFFCLKVSCWPVWRHRDIAYSDIVAVQAEEDSGLNSGAINWPVVKTAQGYRVNMGGKFRVTLTVEGGSAYEIVMKDQTQALDLVQSLEHIRKDSGHATA